MADRLTSIYVSFDGTMSFAEHSISYDLVSDTFYSTIHSFAY